MGTTIESHEIYLDTSYAIALASNSDRFHSEALRLAKQLQTFKARLITSRAIILEIGNALSRQRYRQAAVRLLRALENDPDVEIIHISESLYAQAFQLYAARPDKDWGMTDCISFVIMQERRLSEALTTDEHFKQAGFRALLREEAE